ncbi:MAG: hypothetical protein ABEI98_08285 [Halorhabdus sp.]
MSLSPSRAGRGQTNLDFVVGVSLFIVAIVFVWMFLPNLFAPFTASGSHGDTVTADRAANRLASGTPGHGTGPSTVDESCLVAFFDDSYTDLRCGFDASAPIAQRLGLLSNTPVKVTVKSDIDGDGNKSILSWNKNTLGNAFTEGSGDVTLVDGGKPGSSSEIAIVRRAVSIDGQEATIIVKTW